MDLASLSDSSSMTAVIAYALLATGAAVMGCGSDDGETGAPRAPAPASFEGGEFQLSVHSVQDGCLDGGLTLVFMPDGEAEPYALQNPTYIPGFDELPHTYKMALAAPFQDMELTMAVPSVSGSGAAMEAVGAIQSDVLLSLPGSEDCTADMVFNAEVVVRAPDTVELVTTVQVTGFESPTQTCPAAEQVPCTIALTMTGERL